MGKQPFFLLILGFYWTLTAYRDTRQYNSYLVSLLPHSIISLYSSAIISWVYHSIDCSPALAPFGFPFDYETSKVCAGEHYLIMPKPSKKFVTIVFQCQSGMLLLHQNKMQQSRRETGTPAGNKQEEYMLKKDNLTFWELVQLSFE